MSNNIARVICPNKEEKAFYLFTKRMISKERKIKLKLFPALAFSVVLPLIFIYNSYTMSESYEAFKENLASGTSYLWLYISIAMLVTSLPILSTSENNSGAWVYGALPIADKTNIPKGAIKALLINYYLPPFLLVCSVFLWLFDGSIVPHLIVLILAMILIVVLTTKAMGMDLPFTKEFKSIKDKSMVVFIYSVALCGGGAIVHYIMSIFPYGIYGLMLVIILVLPITWRKVFR